MSQVSQAHLQLLAEIDADIRHTAGLTGVDELSPAVRQALLQVDRRRFVMPEHELAAWHNHPLPIGCGQTISQPYMVALMSELMALTPQSRVLEIGTGSGYQTAILARLAGEVFSVERIQALYERACLQQGLFEGAQVCLECRDGNEGWPEHAPYDAIIVTAAAEQVPESLVAQLAEGGRLVIPLGPAYGGQRLYLGIKENGRLHLKEKLAVSFVPMLPGVKGDDGLESR